MRRHASPFPSLFLLFLTFANAQLGHFSHLTGLDELWISENLVSEFDTVKTLAPVGLECLYLEHNPVSSDFEYRKKVRSSEDSALLHGCILLLLASLSSRRCCLA